eukprot:Sspe_Gene.90603::Locus_62136_Transcript_1_1_Confidence_1.000_Length_563::g.90603::m.90603/K22069/LYRM4; LYR motif-containing protein 4
MVTKSEVLRLYRSLLHEGLKFADYNLRGYTLRRTRDDFREHRGVTDPETINRLYQIGLQNLEVVKRQVIVQRLYMSRRALMDPRGPAPPESLLRELEAAGDELDSARH